MILVCRLSLIHFLLFSFRMKNYQLANVRLNSSVDLALKDHLLVTTSIQDGNSRNYRGRELQ